MDLAKAKKVIQKNFKDYSVKSEILDEDTLVAFICVDLIREDMISENPVLLKPKKKDDANVSQKTKPVGMDH